MKKIKRKTIRGPYTTDEDVAMMQHLYEHNFSVENISIYMKKDPTSIFRYIKKYGFKRKTIQEFLAEETDFSFHA